MAKNPLTRKEAVELLGRVTGKKVIDPKLVQKHRDQLEHTAEKYFGKPELDPRNL